MDTFLSSFIVIILLVILYVYLEGRSYEVKFVKSNVNGKEYLVRNLPDKQQAADLIAKLSMKLEKVVNYISEHNVDSIIKNVGLKIKDKKKLVTDFKRLQKNFNPDKIKESTPDAKFTSYSVNKGEELVFCVRIKKEGDKLMDINPMTFVALHELSHLMTKSVGHTQEFWDNFKIILQISIHIGVYKHIDFQSNPEPYCGIEINDTPYKPGN
jgi:hypothetical protein